MGAKTCMFLVLAIMALTWNGVQAQPSSSCTSVLITMSSCLNYITGNSSNPASSCCSALANVVQSQPQCLCTVLSGGAASSLGVTLNQTRALQLPGACNVQTPPVSRCNGAGSPTESPTGVPDDQPAEGPAASFPSGSGSKTVPSTAGSTSNGNMMSGESSLHLMAAFILSVVTFTFALPIFSTTF